MLYPPFKKLRSSVHPSVRSAVCPSVRPSVSASFSLSAVSIFKRFSLVYIGKECPGIADG